MPRKPYSAAATAALALQAAKAAAKAVGEATKAATAAALVASAQNVAIARLEIQQKADSEKFDRFYESWCNNATENKTTMNGIVEKLSGHKHEEYVSGNKFWAGIVLAIVAALSSVGVNISGK